MSFVTGELSELNPSDEIDDDIYADNNCADIAHIFLQSSSTDLKRVQPNANLLAKKVLSGRITRPSSKHLSDPAAIVFYPDWMD